MILILNNQSAIEIDSEKIQQQTAHILNFLDYQDYDIAVVFTDNTTIHNYNKKYRHKDKPTDILSFPYHSELTAGQHIIPETDDDKNLGDIIMSPTYIQDDLERWGVDFDTRLTILLVHGICHLLGYDHIEDADYEIMKTKEKEILTFLSEQ